MKLLSKCGHVDTCKWEQIQGIVNDALEQPIHKQLSFIEDACGGEKALVSAVLSLLEHYQATQDPLDFSPMAQVESDMVLEAGRQEVGEYVGPYRLLALIAEGGMGAVYLAEQEKPIRRIVALKLILHDLNSQKILSRFNTERQALALMTHPYIAQLYDAGMTNQGPFFAMEYVAGKQFLEYCDLNQLSIASRLALFCQICEAIQHAHQKGIIHRDIKPNNILIKTENDMAIPKIIDFGIAKVLGDEMQGHTQKGMFVGSPQYMSPEQLMGESHDIDVRADIYSLGLNLYQCLVGKHPYAKTIKSLDDLKRRFLQDKPMKPSEQLRESIAHQPDLLRLRQTNESQFNKWLIDDLDWVVLKALACNRDERYQSVNEFAADLRRFLSKKPVLAKAWSRTYLTRKFLGRNKWMAMLAIVTFLTLVSGIAGVTYGLVEARRERAVALEEAARANAVDQFLNSMFSEIIPATLGSGGRMNLEELIRGAEGQLFQKEIDRLVEASLRGTFAQKYAMLNLPKEALNQEAQRFELLRQDLGETHAETLVAKASLADRYFHLNRFEQAKNLAESAAEKMAQHLRPDHPDALFAKLVVLRCLNRLDRFEEAQQLSIGLVQDALMVWSEEQERCLPFIKEAAISYFRQGKRREGLETLSEGLRIGIARLGIEHLETREIMLLYSYFSMDRVGHFLPE